MSTTKTIPHVDILRNAIHAEVFVTTEAARISKISEEKMQWLFDFRAVLLKPEILNAYAEIFWEKYKDRYPFQVCGLEITAVPLVAAIVMKSQEKGCPVNGFFIRKSRKKSGLLKMIEGCITDDPIIIVDDIVNSGSSVIRQLGIIEKEGEKVREIFSILQFRDNAYYTKFLVGGVSIPLVSLFELNDFKETLGVSNIESSDAIPVKDLFGKNAQWIFRGNNPSFFHVFPKSGPVVSGDYVYFGDDGGNFYALRTTDGEIAWSHKVPFGVNGKYIFSTPAILGDTVYFGAYDGNFYALDKITGKKKWIFMEADWIGSSPCTAENLGIVFIGLEFGLINKRGGVAGINAKSGEKIWEFRSPALTHGSPAYSQKFSVVGCGSNDGIFSMLDAKTGKLLWSHKTEGPIKYAPRFSDEHGVIVVLGHGETVYVLKTRTGELITQYKMDFGGYSTPLIVGGKVICTSLDKYVHCFHILTGAALWKFDTGARCFASPELIDGKIYVGSNSARLFELDPETGKASAIFYTLERIVKKIAYDKKTDTFFVPTFANELFALKKVKYSK